MTDVTEACTCPLGDYPHPAHPKGLRTMQPTLCRLEHWDGSKWVERLAVENLLYPGRYLDRLYAAGKVGRVTLLGTGQVVQRGDTSQPPTPSRLLTAACPYCDKRHQQPHDGMCLL